jgi:hypothetical protein
MTDDGLSYLRVAILQRAMHDYIRALKHKDGLNISKLERFFKSEWGELLSNNRGNLLIEECRKRANGKKPQRYAAFSKKK